jgi:hypothetical protein
VLEKGGLKEQMAALTDLGGARGAPIEIMLDIDGIAAPVQAGSNSQTSLGITVMAWYRPVGVNHVQL